MKSTKSLTRRDFAGVLLGSGLGLAALAAGCGGSGGGPSSGKSTPTDATRSRVLTMHNVAVRGITQSGLQTQNLAIVRNSFYGGAAVSEDSAGAPALNAGVGRTGSPMPLVGAFLRNVAAVSPSSRAAHLRRKTRQEDGGGTNGGNGGNGVASPPDGGIVPPGEIFEPAPTFYFDYYLGLWVQTDDSGGSSNYLLYEDEAKTKSAGHITTINPTDWETYPQVYSSSYAFTSGYLAGSHGSSENVTNADYSGSSQYGNVYSDGWKDKGTSHWTAQGDFTWSSRTDGTNGEWSEDVGTFLSDGSGGTRLSSSDGYKSDYRYSSDGSGHGKITGPDPGLPVTISWDAYGNTTIVYADGSTEHIAGWGSDYGGDGGDGDVFPVDEPVAFAK